jgi:hypothetical protein
VSQQTASKVVLAKIQNSDGPDKVWIREQFHRVHPDQVMKAQAWRIKPGEGVQVFGEDKVRRTPGKPSSMMKLDAAYGAVIDDIRTDVDKALLMACIMNESRGNEKASRYEPRIKDYSFGLCQTLTGTAHGLMKAANIQPPDKPISQGGNIEKWRAALCDPRTSIILGAQYLTGLNRRFVLKNDPILIYASYNAGSPRPTHKGTWGLITNVMDNPLTQMREADTLDHIAAWYGDACYVLSTTRGTL